MKVPLRGHRVWMHSGTTAIVIVCRFEKRVPNAGVLAGCARIALAGAHASIASSIEHA